MGSYLEIVMIVFGTVGTGLTVYFGYYRFLQFRWTKKKIQYDLFSKVNQRNDRLYTQLVTLSVGDEKNKSRGKKKEAVLNKYIELVKEKLFYIANDEVSQEIARFWLDGITVEWQIFEREISDFISYVDEKSKVYQPEYRARFDLLIDEYKKPQKDFDTLYHLIIENSNVNM